MIGRKMIGRMCIALVGCCLFFAAAVSADEITDSINEALEYYKAGDLTSAVQSLDYASQLIRQNKASGMTSLLPEPLSGWDADPASSEAAGAAMFGGGVSAERTYRKGDASITIQYMTDSPMMQGVMMMFSNPAFAASDGGRLEKVGGQKAIVKYDAASTQGDIKIIVDNRIFVSVEGWQVQKNDLKAYAEAIDYKKLEAMD